MQTTRRPVRGPDQRIDKRMTILGVVGCVVLAGIFFFLGLTLIGPRIGSPMRSMAAPSQVTPPPPESALTPPAPDRTTQHSGVKVEITEHSADAPTTTPEASPSETEDGGVTQDERGLTVTLEPEDQKKLDESTEKPKEEAISQPARTERKERSRRSTDTRTETETRTKPAPERADLAPARAATERKSSSDTERVYRVQVSAYSKSSDAETLASQLRDRGYRAVVAAAEVGGKTVHRVQIGKFKTREDAQELAKDLTAIGYSPAVLSERN